MTATTSTTAEPIGWHVLAFEAPEPTDWVDYSRGTVEPAGQVGARQREARRGGEPSVASVPVCTYSVG